MVLLMLVATLYGVVQLLVLAWPTRTVRLPAALLAVAVGVYACGALGLALELLVARGLAASSDLQLPDAIRQASYTIDPTIEELVKILPLLVIGINVRSRLQHGLADYVVLGAGLGAGFGLLEAFGRFGTDSDQAIPIPGGGWILPGFSSPYIPGIKQVASGSSSGSSGRTEPEPKGVERREPATKPEVQDPKLRNLVDNLLKEHTRPGRVGDGTTVDAVRNELMTGRNT